MRALFAVLVFTLGLTGSTDAFFVTGHVGGGGSGPPPSTLPLVRTINNPTGSTSPATAFWMIGQPFISGGNPASAPSEVPSGNILTATLGGSPVPIGGCQRKIDASGAMAWAQIMVDASGAAIPAGGSKDLVFTSTPGSWSSTTTRTDADWIALNDTVTISGVTTTSTGGADMDAGPYTATLDGTATVTVLCTSPLGREVQVVANMINGSSVTHRFLQVVMFYWVTEKADTSIGPIAWLGPFIENTQAMKSNPGNFKYTATFQRNGVTVRGGAGSAWDPVAQPSSTIAVMADQNGQWEWTASDPKFWVSQDYTKSAATYKSPPFIHGLGATYVGGNGADVSAPILSVNTGTGVFTVATVFPLQATGGSPSSPTTMTFTGSLGGLSGFSLGTTYWAAGAGTTFKLYANLVDAWAGTNQIAIGGSYSGGLSAIPVTGPESMALFFSATGAGGGRPELNLTSEWGASYLVGNTQAWQRQARVVAYGLTSIPVSTINHATGRIPSFLDAAHTPAALGTALTNFWLGSIAPTGGPPRAPTSATGLWEMGGYSEHIPGNAGFIVWLLEGNPYLQRFGMYRASNDIGSANPTFGRNFSQPPINGGHTYYGVLQSAAETFRQIAWEIRDIGEAAFMAPGGSAEETYFYNELDSHSSWLQAYWVYKGANFVGIGKFNQDEGSSGVSPLAPPYNSNFMTAYGLLGWGFAAMLNPDIATLKTVADTVPILTINQYVGGAFNGCMWWADEYNPGTSLSPEGTLSANGRYVSSPADIGVGEGWRFAFDGATGNITASGGYGPLSGWTPPPGGSPSTTLPFLAGDIYRVFATDSDGAGHSDPPSPIVAGTEYCVVGTPSGATFQVSATCGGSPITSFGSSPTGVGGIMIPKATRACPSTGMWHSGTGSPDIYFQWQRAGLCLNAVRGVPNALAACNANIARNTASFNTTAMWAYGNAP